jgi:RNA polymerase sigma factor (sigma-70 family)
MKTKTMVDKTEKTFLEHRNQNLGIAHKVCRVYFEDAEIRQDVMQEMMYQLWRSFDRFEGKSKFSTWMYSVCINTALTYRTAINKRSNVEKLSEHHIHIPDPLASDGKEEQLKALYHAISSLSKLNKAIVLLYLEDMKYEEIAAVVGITKSNVSVRLVRIKKELETKLKNQKNQVG